MNPGILFVLETERTNENKRQDYVPQRDDLMRDEDPDYTA